MKQSTGILEMSKIKLSDFVVEELFAKGVRHVFELSGGMIAHFLESLYHFKKIDVITMHHEQSVAFAVDGYSRVSDVPTVGFGTSGPGAINLLTGIGSCYFDSVPGIFIVGQVNRHERKGNRKIRQLGFQETDIASMAAPICKKVFIVENSEEIIEILDDAFDLAISGRKGPVLIEVPMDLQRSMIEKKGGRHIERIKAQESTFSKKIIRELREDLSCAKKPLVLVGRGVRSSNSTEELIEFIERYKLPVVSSLHGIDVLPFSHRSHIGFIGTYGNRWANTAIGDCDLLLVLGSRLDIRQTGADTEFFERRKIYHIDIEEAEVNNRVKNCIPLIGDLQQFLKKMNEEFFNFEFQSNTNDWFSLLETNRHKWPDTKELENIRGINPNRFLSQFSEAPASNNAYAYLADVGNHQMWCAQSLRLKKHQLFITSGGMGAMGHCFPASIGVSYALGQKPIISISGDGGFQLNIQELQTVVRNKIPLKIIVLNNQSLGMIRQFQDTYFNGNHQSTVIGYDSPNFELVAKAYGIKAKTIYREEQIDDAILELWREPQEPYLLQVMIDSGTNCYPKIAFGKPLNEMEPLASPIDFEGT